MRAVPLRDLMCGVSQSLEAAMNEMIKRESNRASRNVIKKEDNSPDHEKVDGIPNVSGTGDDTAKVKEVEENGFSGHEVENLKSSPDDDEQKWSGAWSDDEESEDSETEEREEIQTAHEGGLARNKKTVEILDNTKDKAKLIDSTKKTYTNKSSEKGTSECDVCGKTFTTAGTLRVHKLTHLDDNDDAKRPYSCDKCDKKFTQAGSLSVHKRTHMAKDDARLLTFKSVWKCEICGKEFRARDAEHKHRKIHIMEKSAVKRPWECKECGKCFTMKGSLRDHKRLHTGKLPFKCEIDQCQRTFNHKTGLNFHIKCHVTGTLRPVLNPNKGRHKCTLCPRDFEKDLQLRMHIKRHAEDNVGFSSDEEETNVVGKLFRCDQCGKTYDTKTNLHRHKGRVHGGLAHPCHLCESEFRTKFRLVKHLKDVHNVVEEVENSRRFNQPRPFHCEFCPSRFITESDLKKHQSQHAGPSSFKCSRCEEKFTSFDSLEDHKRSVHDPEPYQCLKCEKKFSHLDQLVEHRKLKRAINKKSLCVPAQSQERESETSSDDSEILDLD